MVFGLHQAAAMKRLRRGLGLAVLLLSAGGLEVLDTEEVRCEEAVKHIAECCPGFNVTLVECGGACASPDLDEPTSSGVLQMSCAAVRDHGYCKMWPLPPKGPPEWPQS